jgi:hypothetical protein
MLSPKLFRVLALMLGSTIVLAACGGQPSVPAPAGEAPTAAPTEARPTVAPTSVSSSQPTDTNPKPRSGGRNLGARARRACPAPDHGDDRQPPGGLPADWSRSRRGGLRGAGRVWCHAIYGAVCAGDHTRRAGDRPGPQHAAVLRAVGDGLSRDVRARWGLARRA